MDRILKAATVVKQAAGEAELALINAQTLRPLAAEEVYTFRLAACDDQVDRDFERFTGETLEGLATLFVGKSVLMDHTWRAESQTARVYAAGVEDSGGVKRLILRCYMPRTEQTAGTITAIDAGILRECSVGCAVRRAMGIVPDMESLPEVGAFVGEMYGVTARNYYYVWTGNGWDQAPYRAVFEHTEEDRDLLLKPPAETSQETES